VNIFQLNVRSEKFDNNNNNNNNNNELSALSSSPKSGSRSISQLAAALSHRYFSRLFEYLFLTGIP
jgi:hypothetical protein